MNKMVCQFLCVWMVCDLSSQVTSAQTRQNSTNATLQSAAQNISAGKLENAETELQSVLRSTPEDVRALDLLGVIRVLQHRESQAEELFAKVVRKDPEFGPGHAHLGLVYVQMGRDDEAIPQLREALRIDPTRSDAVAGLAHILQKQSKSAVEAGDYGKALKLLNEARADAPDDADVQYEFGVVAQHLALQEDAVDAFQRTLQLRKHDALARYNLGRAFMALSKFEEARQQFSEYIKLRSGDPSGHCALGMTLAALERSEEARSEFERSIALEPQQAESFFRLGLLELESRNFEAASKNLRHVIDLEPTHAPALTALGKLAFEQKNYEEAQSTLLRAINRDDSIREAHYYLGLTFARLGRESESREQLEIATRLEHEETEHRRTVMILDPGAPGTPSKETKK